MTHRTTAIVFAILMLLVSVDVRSKSRTDVTENGNFEDRVKPLVVELNAAKDVTSLEARVRVHVDSGEVRWELIDPDGVPRLRGRGRSGRISTESDGLEVVPGTWRLRFEFENATGDYRWSWKAR